MAPCLKKGWYKRRSTSSYFLGWQFVRQGELGRHARTGPASNRSGDYASIAHATLRTQEFLKAEEVTWMVAVIRLNQMRFRRSLQVTPVT